MPKENSKYKKLFETDSEKLSEMLTLHAYEVNKAVLARKYNCSVPTIRYWCDEYAFLFKS